ncbi:tautomerase family protein [Sulfitobacter sp. TSTF-M16]|uniref:Tautomerase family protein n=2 Tax=Sulfitobacter aestuariivivens TaxID=2766981 RepID=A0A927D3L5_9RHOB|nr:tautomerase family protein [Sulfitobacter aestuariivivens]MBD3664530.1 tautomerase family protein [Sulfitobacter aestuariivivens]
MPVVEVHLIEGYDDAEKQRLGTALTDAVRSVVPAGPEAITVLLHDLPASDYYRGGTRRTPAPALPDPADLVRAYLAAMEARDLKKAQAMLGDGFTMSFPGTAPMRTLQELMDWAAPRYRFVKKTYEIFDVSQGADAAIVHCHGMLNGEWPDGTLFEGIRFIDRFELKGGRITKQDVWNDMGEVRP